MSESSERLVVPSADFLKAVMPRLDLSRLVDPDDVVELAERLTVACREFDILTARRVAAFVAQLAHESGELQFWNEIWGPTPTQLTYEPPSRKAAELGNTEPGDGRRFRGHGPIQITGRGNHRKAGQALGLDLEARPELAASHEHGFRVSAWVWKTFGCNDVADLETRSAFKQITRRINGGYNGLAEREKYHHRARTALSLEPVE
jgi:putative chitinase